MHIFAVGNHVHARMFFPSNIILVSECGDIVSDENAYRVMSNWAAWYNGNHILRQQVNTLTQYWKVFSVLCRFVSLIVKSKS